MRRPWRGIWCRIIEMKTNKQTIDDVKYSINGVIRFDAFDYFHTEPRMALWELAQRRKESGLKEKVRQTLGSTAETILKKFIQPRAVLFRQVATPTHEIIRFLRLAKHMKLKPLILEYHGDKFVSSDNRYKRSLGKMPIYEHTGSDGRDMVRYETVCDFNTSTGKPFTDIQCLHGESLIAFHHRLFRAITGLNPKTHCVDATHWFDANGRKAVDYYEHLLTLFVRDGILFENYFTTKSEGPFVTESVLPAFKRIQQTYGYSPLIVRLLPSNEELRLFWDAYTKKVRSALAR